MNRLLFKRIVIKKNYVPSIFYLLALLLYPLYGVSSELPMLDEDKPSKSQIDWSKPVVSRGFGYKAENEQDLPYETKYKQAQIAYFFGQYDKALQLWLPLVEKKHVESMASVAWLYHAGLGTEKNLQKAFDLYQQAAAKGNSVAQNNLGVMYENGELVKKDLTKAREWYKLSAENGYRFAQYNYASALQHGFGGDIDLENAILWYKKAANQGVKQAEQQLSLLNKEKSEN